MGPLKGPAKVLMVDYVCCQYIGTQTQRSAPTIAGPEVRGLQAAVLAKAADDDGDTGEEEDQPDDDACHHQGGHQEGGVLWLEPAIFELPIAVVEAHCREGCGGRESKKEKRNLGQSKCTL